MSDERCPTCDRPKWIGDRRDLPKGHCYTLSDCEANRVDWRRRALEFKSLLSESQEGHARTVAELWDAKAEHDRLRAFVETVATWTEWNAGADLAAQAERMLRGEEP